jgi:hypothetical protein
MKNVEKWLSFTQTADIHKKGLHSQKGCNKIMEVNYFNVSLGCLFPSPSILSLQSKQFK